MKIREWLIAMAVLLLGGLWAACQADTPEVWHDLQPGPYCAGFRTIESYDFSRTFVPKYNYMGEPNEGLRARPIQVCLWYPAVSDSFAVPMTYGEYSFPYPTDERLFGVLSRLQDREIRDLFTVTGDQAAVLQMMSVPLAAVRDAQPAEGTFPLIVYHQSLGGASCENAVLCEYLATHGFMVLTTPTLGLTSLIPEENPADLENLIRDKEFTLGLLRDSSDLAFDQLLLLGNGIGALAALDMQMRDPDVEAVIALGNWLSDSVHAEFCRHSPSFNPDRMNVPLLQIAPASEEGSKTIFSDFTYSRRIALTDAAIRGSEFVAYPMFSAATPELDATLLPLRESHQRICEAVRLYFENCRDKTESFAAGLPEKFADAVTVTQYDAEQLPPTPQQFAELLQGGYVDTAVALFNHFHDAEPERVLFAEGTVNILGYQALQSGNSEQAIKLFVMNTVAYPNSCNTWDSLSDGYLAAGDNDNAIIAMRRALETLETDTTNPDQLKEQIRTKCEQTIAELGG